MKIFAVTLAIATVAALPVAAEQVALEQCVLSKVERLGISPDLAYKTCQRDSIVNCIKKLSLLVIVQSVILNYIENMEKPSTIAKIR